MVLLLRFDGNRSVPACFYFRQSGSPGGRALARSAPFSVAINSLSIWEDRRAIARADHPQGEAPPAAAAKPAETNKAVRPEPAQVEYALSSSFAFGGLNAVLALRKA